MNDKVTMQELVDLFAEKNGLTQKEADLFVRSFFEEIEEALGTEKYVKIKGLGTFKLTEVDSRESINVNTGERIEIQGHTKISFVPDTGLKELVNKPFSHFETVILNEGTQLEDTPVVSAEELARENEEGSEEEVAAEATPTANVAEGGETATDTAEPTDAATEVPEEATASQEATDAPEATAPEEATAPTVAAQTADTAPDAATATTTATATSTEAAPAPIAATAPEEATTASQEATVSDATPQVPESSTEESKASAEASVSAARESATTQGNTWKTVSIVLAVLLIALLVGGFFYYRHLKSQQTQLLQENKSLVIEVKEQQEATQAGESSAAQDSHAQSHQGDAAQERIGGADGATDIHLGRSQQGETTGSQSASGEATALQNGKQAAETAQNGAGIARLKLDPEKTYRIAGTQGIHTLRSGESLVRIAVKYFGAKDFWPYIAEHNSDVIKDADRVPIGTDLKIPLLKEAE